MANNLRRRSFLGSAAGAAALTAAPQILRGQGTKIRLGYIGMGRRGRSTLRGAQQQPEIEVTAFSEIFQPNIDRAKELLPNAKHYLDFRDLLADSEIDAVCICTPDHWHAYMCIEACKAGKDVYVEKPISVTIHEGQMMVQAAKKYGQIIQVGTQQRSGDHFQQAVSMIHDRVLGDISFVRTWNYSNQFPQGIGNPPDSDPPEGFDWDMWLGPAPERPFNENRFGYDPNAFSHFRWFWDYAGGMMTDWGIHLLDIVLWAMKVDGPNAVVCVGDKYVLTDNRETPDTIQATFEFSDFACTYENRIGNAESMFDKRYGILFHGTNGTLFVDRRGWEITPEIQRVPGGSMQRMGAASGESGNDSTAAHWADFVKAIQTREQPICDIETGHRSTVLALLGNIALRSRQRVDWDPASETTQNSEAATYLQREYRDPWKLEL